MSYLQSIGEDVELLDEMLNFVGSFCCAWRPEGARGTTEHPTCISFNGRYDVRED